MLVGSLTIKISRANGRTRHSTLIDDRCVSGEEWKGLTWAIGHMEHQFSIQTRNNYKYSINWLNVERKKRIKLMIRWQITDIHIHRVARESLLEILLDASRNLDLYSSIFPVHSISFWMKMNAHSDMTYFVGSFFPSLSVPLDNTTMSDGKITIGSMFFLSVSVWLPWPTDCPSE